MALDSMHSKRIAYRDLKVSTSIGGLTIDSWLSLPASLSFLSS
jgi:hypothetical protein